MPSCPFCHKDVPESSTVCPHCLRAQPLTVPTATRGKGGSAAKGFPWRTTALVAVVMTLGVYAFRERGHMLDSLSAHQDAADAATDVAAPAPSAAPVAVQTTIAPPLDLRIADSASATVAPGAFLAFPFSGEDRTGCHVTGTARTLGGGTVNVMVVDREGADDLAAGRRPRTYYESGATSSAALDVHVDGRSHYVLVVQNPGAKGRARKVRLAIGARCAD